MSGVAGERWVTKDDIAAALARYVEQMPGFENPLAYGVARIDGEGTTFGHVNDIGGTHRLPAVILAFVCGHRVGNATYELSAVQFAEAIERLSPAEACEEYDHPNLWSWRALVESATPESTYVAVYVNDVSAPPTDRYDAAFRSRLTR